MEPVREAGAELRRAPRKHHRARISVVPVIDGAEQTAISVLLRDLSARGMCFIHNQSIRAGSQVLACFPGEEGSPTLMLCTVAHCRSLSKNVFSVGAEFTCRVPRPSEGSIPSDYDRIRQSILD